MISERQQQQQQKQYQKQQRSKTAPQNNARSIDENPSTNKIKNTPQNNDCVDDNNNYNRKVNNFGGSRHQNSHDSSSSNNNNIRGDSNTISNKTCNNDNNNSSYNKSNNNNSIAFSKPEALKSVTGGSSHRVGETGRTSGNRKLGRRSSQDACAESGQRKAQEGSQTNIAKEAQAYQPIPTENNCNENSKTTQVVVVPKVKESLVPFRRNSTNEVNQVDPTRLSVRNPYVDGDEEDDEDEGNEYFTDDDVSEVE